MSDLTLGELAGRVGMTPRNIREWQTIGVLDPPERRGRTAYYSTMHIARIERIKSLRAEGFPLDVIRQFLDRSKESAAHVMTLSSAVLDPANTSGRSIISREELRRRLGPAAEDAMVRSGLVDLDDDDATITDVSTFEHVEQLVAIGLPVDAVMDALDGLLQHQVRGVETFVDLYRAEVWQPFVDAGFPAARFSEIAETSGRMRELVIGLGGQTLRRATDKVIGHVAVEQATKLSADD